MVYRSRPRWATLQGLDKDLSISFEPEDSDTMSFQRSKRTLCNGYSRHSSLSLATLECHAQKVATGPGSQTESGSLRWSKSQKLQHNSSSVRDCLRECGFVTNLHQTQTPLPVRKCALELPTQFIGQRNCGVPVCVVDQQSGSVKKPPSSGQTEVSQHTFDRCHRLKSKSRSNLKPPCEDSMRPNSLKSMGLVEEYGDGPRSMHEVIFSTEVPPTAALDRHNGKEGNLKFSDTNGQVPGGEKYAFSSKKTQNALRDQICRVVVNLEEVLRGLKDVHLEMKEVVQQIDQLTSSIDLEEEDAKDTTAGSSSSRKGPTLEDALKHTGTKTHPVRDISGLPYSLSHHPSTVPRANKRYQASSKDQPDHKTTPRVPPPAYSARLSGTNSLVLKSNHGVSESKGVKSEVGKGSRSQKPPPYPCSGRKASKGKDPGLKTPPYSGKRKLLSTTV